MGDRRRGPLAGISVLFVDDNEDTREIIRVVLKYAGALVRVAGDARHACDILRRFRPDVVVSDLTIPDIDGVEFLELLHASPTWQDIPAIALTAVSEPEQEQRARAAGFDAYLVKPIDTPALVAKIVRVVLQSRGQR